MKKLRLQHYFLYLSLLIFAPLSNATTSQEMSFTDLVNKSDACVVASVISSKSVTEGGGVFTYTQFKVKETAFGSPNDVITVKTPGGERKLGRLLTAEVVPGSPQFFSNQDSLLFLSGGNGADQYLITGFSQGALNVTQGASGSTVELRTTGEVSVDEALDSIRELRDATNSNN